MRLINPRDLVDPRIVDAPQIPLTGAQPVEALHCKDVARIKESIVTAEKDPQVAIVGRRDHIQWLGGHGQQTQKDKKNAANETCHDGHPREIGQDGRIRAATATTAQIPAPTRYGLNWKTM